MEGEDQNESYRNRVESCKLGQAQLAASCKLGNNHSSSLNLEKILRQLRKCWPLKKFLSMALVKRKASQVLNKTVRPVVT
jgi:hypothetical protein